MDRPSIDAAAIAAASMVAATIGASAEAAAPEDTSEFGRSWPDRAEQLYVRFFDFVRNYEQPAEPRYEA